MDNNGQPQHAFIGKLKIRTSALKPAHKHDGWCQPIDRLRSGQSHLARMNVMAVSLGFSHIVFPLSVPVHR